MSFATNSISKNAAFSSQIDISYFWWAFPKAQSIFRFRLQGSFVPAKCDVPSYSRFPWCYICSYFESTAFPRFRFREFRKFLFCSWAIFFKNSFRLATTVWIRRYPTVSLCISNTNPSSSQLWLEEEAIWMGGGRRSKRGACRDIFIFMQIFLFYCFFFFWVCNKCLSYIQY